MFCLFSGLFLVLSGQIETVQSPPDPNNEPYLGRTFYFLIAALMGVLMLAQGIITWRNQVPKGLDIFEE
jgi:hypothetical protein